MFNIEDKETIMKLIDIRNKDELVVPVYLRVGNNTYYLSEVDEITSCSPSIFKVGFGSSDSVFIRNKFPKNKLINFTNPRTFTNFNEEEQCATEYITFESSDLEYDRTDLTNEINKWYFILLDYTMIHVEENKKLRIKKMMEEQS
jgi:hypothetical protein